MALVSNLFAAGIPATWMKDDLDGVKVQPTDAADATRPDIWTYEGAWYKSAVGPAGEDGITITTNYTPSWAFLAAVFSDIGSIPLSGTYPGDAWDMSTGRAVLRYYVDAAVKAEAAYLVPLTIYSSDSRGGLGSGNYAVLVGFFDDGGTYFRVDTYCGVRAGSDYDTSAQFLWSDVLNKWVEFDVRWRCQSGTFAAPVADGYVSIRMRTSTDGTTWTDLPGTSDAVVLDTGPERIANSAFVVKSGAVTYGMSIALGFAGMPGKCYYAKLYDSDDAEFAPGVGQSFGPLVWVEWEGSDGTIRKWAPVDLPDPATYYHGYKAPKLLSAGRVVRALSDEQGEYQGQTFEVTIDDSDRDIRTLLGASDSRRHLLNTRAVMRMISEEDWRAKRVPRTVAIGLLRGYRNH